MRTMCVLGSCWVGEREWRRAGGGEKKGQYSVSLDRDLGLEVGRTEVISITAAEA